MPNLNFIPRFPLPTLRTYTAVSGVILLATVLYAHRIVSVDDEWNEKFITKMDGAALSGFTKDWVSRSNTAKIAYFMVSDQISIWVAVNTVCCCFLLCGKLIQMIVFGKLRAAEYQLIRDRFWNFSFHRFVFLFGVLSVHYLDELLLWCLWFSGIGLCYMLTSISHDRFKYVCSSPSSARIQIVRSLVLLVALLCCSLFMLLVAAVVSHRNGINYGGFLAADAIMMLFRCLYAICRYGFLVFDSSGGSWENRTSVVYYMELTFELLILMTDFIHHLHMLLWVNYFFSVASLVLCLQLRHLYQEIDRRLKRHRNYQRVIQHINENYPTASPMEGDEKCAICWDLMSSARRLPCGHMFHNWCLRSWIEQDASCPTCRIALSMPRVAGEAQVAQLVRQDGGQEFAPGFPRRRHATNHFFHFDGARYSRWLPSFSVEVSHNLGGSRFLFGPRPSAADANTNQQRSSHLNRLADQVQELFSHVPRALIIEDLEVTNSVETTIDNILEGRLFQPDMLDVDRSSTSDSETADHTSTDEEASISDDSPPNSHPANTSSSFIRQRVVISSMNTAVNSEPVASTSTGFPTVSSGDSSFTVTSGINSGLGARFSKNSEEREMILEDRKKHLVDLHRRKYLDSANGGELRQARQD